MRSYIEGAAGEGATVVVDGTDAPDTAGARDADGFFVGCSLIDGVEPGMRVYDDEIFGPVLGVVRVADLDAALDLVNANQYGNGVALFTRDGGAARRFEREVQVGMIGINVPIPVPVASHSFGGWKASLFGDTTDVRPRGHPLLHAPQGRHLPLAGPRHERHQPRLPVVVKVEVDADSCGGFGQCVTLCPDVFELTVDGYAVVLRPDVPAEFEAVVREAEKVCPTHAITVT